MVTDEMLNPGRIVAGRYEIMRPIGRGGMSVVYQAADLKLGRMLRAVKTIRPDAPGGSGAALSELRVLQRISHPRLPHVVDVVPPEGGTPLLLVMDYVEGETLAAAFERAGRSMPPDRAAYIVLQLCDALAYLHALEPPIVHLDIKPSNILLDAAGGIRLIDFGIARQAGEGGVRPAPNLGTPGYAAPEQQRGAACGPASDLYAAGALLHALLAGGRLPVPNERRFAYVPPNVPAPFRDVLARMLRRDPAERPSAREAAMLLAETAASVPGAAAALTIAGVPSAHPDEPLTVGVASFSRGAGATFAAVTLAVQLAALRPAALIEHPANEPELLALLAGGAAPLVPQGSSAVRPISPRHIAWEAAPHLQVHALLEGADDASGSGSCTAEPADANSALELAAIAACLRLRDRSAGERPIAVLDLSSNWLVDPSCRDAAERCGLLLMIADPQAQRWTQARRSAWRAVKQRRLEAGLPPAVWLANRDAPDFQARRDWLALLPERPSAVLPQLPSGEWHSRLWKGKRPDEHPAWRRKLEDALRPVLDGILQV